MRKLAILTAAVVTGCEQTEPSPEAEVQQVVASLERGTADACTNPQTIQVVRDIIYGPESRVPMYMPLEDLQLFLAEMQSGVEMVTLNGIDVATKKISCSGRFFATWNGRGGNAQIAYDVQPALDTGSFVVYVQDLHGARSAYSAAANAYHSVHVAPRLALSSARWTNQSRFNSAENLCSLYSNSEGSPGDYDRGRMEGVLAAGDALGLGMDDPNYACIKRILARPQPSADAATAAQAEAARRASLPEDRVEYVGPPIILPGPPPPPPRPVVLPTVITNPMWGRPVQPEFPERARAAGIESGSVSLDCGMRPNGSLTECSVVSEDPAGAGFGPAAMAAVGRARVTPSSVAGVVPGGRTRFTVRFRDVD